MAVLQVRTRFLYEDMLSVVADRLYAADHQKRLVVAQHYRAC